MAEMFMIGGKRTSLVDLVFSWSLDDIMNEDLFRQKVKKIGAKFDSLNGYLSSFVLPLVEELRAEFSSALEMVSKNPFLRIDWLDAAKPSTERLAYYFHVRRLHPYRESGGAENGDYSPKRGDIIVLCDVRPAHFSDLGKNGEVYRLAIVTGGGEDDLPPDIYKISTSCRIQAEKCDRRNRSRSALFGVYLGNITTYSRIWACLNHKVATERNLTLINAAIAEPQISRENCKKITCINGFDMVRWLNECDLNVSQIMAVLGCISSMYCNGVNPLNLIWGPPGTGKTKTLSALLWLTGKADFRTVACAPTNIAVMQLASLVLSLVKANDESERPCLGNMVLFGSKDRMNVEEDELREIFLDYRVKILMECFSFQTGWRYCLDSLIEFLAHCPRLYDEFLEDRADDGRRELPFLIFVRKRFRYLYGLSQRCFGILIYHLPTASISVANFENIELLLDLAGELDFLFHRRDTCHNLRAIFHYQRFRQSVNYSRAPSSLLRTRLDCLRAAVDLRDSLTRYLPVVGSKGTIVDLCLKSVSIIFCSTSSSYKLHRVDDMGPLDLVVIDEAAQLKECESLIPFQLFGLKHAVLAGDECKLPALVKSKVSSGALFGRSLFERISSLGHGKHLLNMQYRMHPSIGLFPNTVFYERQIPDAPSVMSRAYERRFLSGAVFGPYSFVNVDTGEEDSDNSGPSKKNMVEVAVIVHILKELSQGNNTICIRQPFLVSAFGIGIDHQKHSHWH